MVWVICVWFVHHMSYYITISTTSSWNGSPISDFLYYYILLFYSQLLLILRLNHIDDPYYLTYAMPFVIHQQNGTLLARACSFSNLQISQLLGNNCMYYNKTLYKINLA